MWRQRLGDVATIQGQGCGHPEKPEEAGQPLPGAFRGSPALPAPCCRTSGLQSWERYNAAVLSHPVSDGLSQQPQETKTKSLLLFPLFKEEEAEAQKGRVVCHRHAANGQPPRENQVVRRQSPTWGRWPEAQQGFGEHSTGRGSGRSRLLRAAPSLAAAIIARGPSENSSSLNAPEKPWG